MKSVDCVVNYIIRKARCQDVDNCGDEEHCQYHLGIDTVGLETAVRIESTIKNGNEHADR